MTQTANTPDVCREMVVIIRPSFMRLCGEDACRAALFNHLLYWIAQKAKGQPADKIRSGEVYWYGSAEDIYTGLSCSWSIWKVRKEISALANTLIGQRHNPKKRWDREYQYFFGEKQGEMLRTHCLENAVCLRHLGLSSDVIHLLKVVGAITENSKCICPNNQPNS